MRKRLFIHGPQLFDRGIRIRRRLKIRKEVFALAIPHPHPLDALIDLAKNTCPRQPTARAETSVITKSAAARCYRAVHIGASKASVDADLLHASAKSSAEEEITRVV